MTGRQPVSVSVRLTCHPGYENEVAREITGIAARVRDEPICLHAAAHQHPDDPCRFLTFERFRDRHELDEFRRSSTYMQAYFARMRPKIASAELDVWTALGG